MITGLLALGFLWLAYLAFNPPVSTNTPMESVSTVQKLTATTTPKKQKEPRAAELIQPTDKNDTPKPAEIHQTSATIESGRDVANQHSLATIQFSESSDFGTQLIPNLAKEFLRAQGISELKQVPTDIAGETAVVGRSSDNSFDKAVKIILRSVAGPPQSPGANEAYIGTLSEGTKFDPARLDLLENSNIESHEAHAIALESLVLIIHPSNPVAMLSKDQLAAILSGMITDWNQVRGKPGKIKIYMMRGKRGWNDTIKSSILGNLSLATNVVGFDDPTEIENQVVSDEGAIGLIKFSEIKNAKILGVSVADKTPVIPNRHTITAQTYPLIKPIYLYLPAKSRSTLLDRFFSFTQSDLGRKVVAQAGYIFPERRVNGLSKLQMTVHEYQELTENAMRLSLGIHFDANSTRLNDKGRRDVSKVSDFLNDLGMKDKRLMVFGFTDSLGSPRINFSLSQKRARAVAASLKKRGIKTEIAIGLGAQNPVAGNETVTGRNLNRRVEIWVKRQVDENV